MSHGGSKNSGRLMCGARQRRNFFRGKNVHNLVTTQKSGAWPAFLVGDCGYCITFVQEVPPFWSYVSTGTWLEQNPRTPVCPGKVGTAVIV